MLICSQCQRAYVGKDETTRAACECGVNLMHPRRGMVLTDMYAQRRARITADEEERLRLGYEVTSHYRAGGRQRAYRVLAGDREAFRLIIEHKGEVLLLNRGQREREGDPRGFTFCGKCHRWLVGKQVDEEHVSTSTQRGQCPQAAQADDLVGHLWLMKRIHTPRRGPEDRLRR